jgi:acyl-CoA dehydrogenase
MDFDFSPEQYTLRDEARHFLEQQCSTAHVREFIDDPAGWSRALWKQMGELGWMALPFPEDIGGLGQSFLDLVLLLGELGRAVAPVPFLSSIGMAGQIVLRHGSDEQRKRYLPGIAFTWEHDMHLYQKRIKSLQALFGDEAFHRERIAKLVGL